MFRRDFGERGGGRKVSLLFWLGEKFRRGEIGGQNVLPRVRRGGGDLAGEMFCRALGAEWLVAEILHLSFGAGVWVVAPSVRGAVSEIFRHPVGAKGMNPPITGVSFRCMGTKNTRITDSTEFLFLFSDHTHSSRLFLRKKTTMNTTKIFSVIFAFIACLPISAMDENHTIPRKS